MLPPDPQIVRPVSTSPEYLIPDSGTPESSTCRQGPKPQRHGGERPPPGRLRPAGLPCSRAAGHRHRLAYRRGAAGPRRPATATTVALAVTDDARALPITVTNKHGASVELHGVDEQHETGRLHHRLSPGDDRALCRCFRRDPLQDHQTPVRTARQTATETPPSATTSAAPPPDTPSTWTSPSHPTAKPRRAPPRSHQPADIPIGPHAQCDVRLEASPRQQSPASEHDRVPYVMWPGCRAGPC
jgi:hypothetical protein